MCCTYKGRLQVPWSGLHCCSKLTQSLFRSWACRSQRRGRNRSPWPFMLTRPQTSNSTRRCSRTGCPAMCHARVMRISTLPCPWMRARHGPLAAPPFAAPSPPPARAPALVLCADHLSCRFTKSRPCANTSTTPKPTPPRIYLKPLIRPPRLKSMAVSRRALSRRCRFMAHWFPHSR